MNGVQQKVNIMVTSDKQNKSVKEKPLTTYERMMQDPEFRKSFEIGYQQFAASEIMLQLMEEKNMTEREVADAAEIPLSVIEDFKDWDKSKISLDNFIKIMQVVGGKIVVQEGERTLPLDR